MTKRIVTKPATNEQKLYLIGRLEKDLELARNQFSSAEDGRALLSRKWDELAKELNGIGGANKCGQSWKKYFEDLRSRTKAKFSKLKYEIGRSGVGGSDPLDELDETEKRIISIMSYDAVDGDGQTEELGVRTPASSNPASHSSARPSHSSARPSHSSARPSHSSVRPSHSSVSPSHSSVSPSHSSVPPTKKTTKKRKIDMNDDYLKTILDLKKEKIILLREQIKIQKGILEKATNENECLRQKVQDHEKRILHLENLFQGEFLTDMIE